MEFKRISAIKESAKSYEWLYLPKHANHLDTKQYKELVNIVLKKLMKYLIITGHKVPLPSRLGSFQFLKYKKEKKYIGYNDATKNINNKDTNGYWFKFKWFKDDGNRLNKETATFYQKFNYRFEISRPNLRPNTYNKSNPEVSAIPFFKEKGWLTWKEDNYIPSNKNDKEWFEEFQNLKRRGL